MYKLRNGKLLEQVENLQDVFLRLTKKEISSDDIKEIDGIFFVPCTKNIDDIFDGVMLENERLSAQLDALVKTPKRERKQTELSEEAIAEKIMFQAIVEKLNNAEKPNKEEKDFLVNITNKNNNDRHYKPRRLPLVVVSFLAK
ncbi:MAG: hypothetical protein WCH07_03310 [Deltaproteobacteria bacterium]